MEDRLILGLVALMGAAVGGAIGARELVVVAGGLGLAAVLSGLSQWSCRGLQVDIVAWPERIVAGAATEVRVGMTEAAEETDKAKGNSKAEATKPAALPRLGLRATRRARPGDGRPDITAPDDGTALRVRRRGRYELDVVVSDVLGLHEWRLPRRRDAVLRVHPAVHEPVVLPRGAEDEETGRVAIGPPGGETFQYLREYVVGDDPRLIHWAATAERPPLGTDPWPLVRHQVVVEEPEVVVVLDTARASYANADEADEAFEDAVRAAATLVVAGSTDRRVRLLVGGDEESVAVLPGGHTIEVLDRLAEVAMRPHPGPYPGTEGLGRLGPDLPAGTTALVVSGPTPAATDALVASVRDQGIRSVVGIHLGGGVRPAGLAPGDHWFPTSAHLAEHWRPGGAGHA